MCNSQLHETIIRRGGSSYFASNERTQNISPTPEYLIMINWSQCHNVDAPPERDPLLHRPPVDGVCLGINISGSGFALYEVSTCKRTTASLHRRRRRYCLVWLHHVVVFGDYLTPSKFSTKASHLCDTSTTTHLSISVHMSSDIYSTLPTSSSVAQSTVSFSVCRPVELFTCPQLSSLPQSISRPPQPTHQSFALFQGVYK